MTYSVCARLEAGDGATAFGAAVATGAPAVGALAPYVSERGAVCTQSFVNVRLGRRGVALLSDLAVEDALSGLLARDDDSALRQLHGVDREGTFASSGEECDGWFGHEVHDDRGVTAAGNMLTGPETLSAAVAALDEPATDPVDRLLAALVAGRDAGGDERGHSSAAVVVSAPETTAYHDLRVDHHETPVAELRRVYEAAKEASEEFAEGKKSRIFD